MTAESVLPVPRSDWGIFLDVDGTLLEIAPTPSDVVVAPKVLSVLDALFRVTDGAVALISGRPLSELDGLFTPMRLPAAGLHGLELRTASGDVRSPPPPSSSFESMREALAACAARHAGLLFENKKAALALHYRKAPHLEAEVRDCVDHAIRRWGDGYQLLAGKMVFEIRPAHADKGTVIETLMTTAPFAGRRPVYAGDDVTDEDAFAAVNRMGGESIRVGAGDGSCAHYRIANVSALLDWLSDVADRLDAIRTETRRNGSSTHD